MFEKLLIRGTDDDSIGVAHHGNQHVEQQDGDEDLEQDEHDPSHGGVGRPGEVFILVFSQSHVEQSYPGGHVAPVHSILAGALHDVEEGLGEAKEEDDVDDGECEHVTSDHGEYHGHKWSSQLDSSKNEKYIYYHNNELKSPCKEHQVEPRHWNSEHQQRFLNQSILQSTRLTSTHLLSGGIIINKSCKS